MGQGDLEGRLVDVRQGSQTAKKIETARRTPKGMGQGDLEGRLVDVRQGSQTAKKTQTDHSGDDSGHITSDCSKCNAP